MSIIQVQGGGGRVAADRSSFVGVRVPPEIKAMVKKSAKMDKDVIRKLLKRMYTSLKFFWLWGSFQNDGGDRFVGYVLV